MSVELLLRLRVPAGAALTLAKALVIPADLGEPEYNKPPARDEAPVRFGKRGGFGGRRKKKAQAAKAVASFM